MKKILYKKNIISDKAAFSLVEILVVLFIISLGLLGILSLIVQSIQSQDYNKNNLIAYQLSQEGVELIRRVRDSNWASAYDFNYSLAEASGILYEYCMDYKDLTPQASSVPCALRLDGDGYYTHELLGPKSDFSRLISVKLLGPEDGIDALSVGQVIRVRSEVFWRDRKNNNSYLSEALLYDWYYAN